MKTKILVKLLVNEDLVVSYTPQLEITVSCYLEVIFLGGVGGGGVFVFGG